HLATRLRTVSEHLGRLDRRCDSRIVAAGLQLAGIRVSTFAEEASVQKARDDLEKALLARHPDLMPLTVKVGHDAEAGHYLEVKFRPGASSKPGRLTAEIADT